MDETISTPLTRALAISVPIIQAPIGSFCCAELTAAVSNAGGLGMHALSWSSPEVCKRQMDATRALTNRSFGANFVLEWDQSERLATCLDAGLKIASFFWGDAGRYIEKTHAAGAKAMVTVGSAEEAKRAVDAGADVIVCQGFEAGGHVCGHVGTMALVPAVVDAVSPVPVVAAGGIADGRGLAAALCLGASGIWMGSRFSASAESLAHPEFKKRLCEARETDTEYAIVFEGGWANAPHRTLRNSTVTTWRAAGSALVGARPGEGEVIGRRVNGEAIYRYDDTPPIAGMTGDWEACAGYAGESVGIIQTCEPAGDIVRRIVGDAKRILSDLGRRVE